ncbi:MAG: ribosome silencing factor [Verrucomicrobiales bacterium]|nr:ribosome silencing factor [Verrucomicrobiales bacterium]
MADAQTIAETCAKFADEIQAENIVVLDLRGISTIADYFVIGTGTSTPHLKAILRDVRKNTAEAIGEEPRSSEGNAESQWLVIDYVDVIVHIFHKDIRDVYALEDLWSDAPRVEYDFLKSPEEAEV